MSKPVQEVHDPDPSSAPKPALSTLSRWIEPAALLIAVCAAGIAIGALVRSPGEPAVNVQAPPAANAQQSADAEARVCAAFDTVRTAVSLRTRSDRGSNPVAVQAVTANARMSMAAGGSFLLARLDPATPSPLDTNVRSFALNLQEISMNAMAGISNDDPAQAARLRDGQEASTRIAELCK
jgi:hypothetical protein